MADPFTDFFTFLTTTALPRFALALGTTLLIAAFAILIGFVLGILAGTGRAFGNAVVSKICAVYIEVVRGVPLIVQLLIWRYGFTGFYAFLKNSLGLPVDEPILAAILAIGVNSGGYQAEIVRAGVNAIPTGQTEAGLSLGMNRGQVIKTVLLPQTLRLSIPPLINEFVIIIKDTSLASAIGIFELAKIAYSLQSDFPGRIFEITIINGLIYWVICFAVSMLSKLIEKKLAIAGYGVKGRKSLL